MATLSLSRTSSRPATDAPVNHTPRPTRAPMTKDPFLLQQIPQAPLSPPQSRIANIFHHRRQASRQGVTHTGSPTHPPTSMPAPLANDIEMGVLQHGSERAKKTDSTSTSMGTPRTPSHPNAAPQPTAHHHTKSAPVHKTARTPGYRGSLLEGVRYSAGGEPVGWYEMFEATRKFEGGFVETSGGEVRCVHPSCWGDGEWGELGQGGGIGGGGQAREERAGSGEEVGDGEALVSGRSGFDVADGIEQPAQVAPNAVASPAGMERADSDTLGNNRMGRMERADSETLGSGRFGEVVVPTKSRSVGLRGGLIGLDCGDEGDEEGDGERSRTESNAMEMIKVILDEGPPSGVMKGRMSREM